MQESNFGNMASAVEMSQSAISMGKKEDLQPAPVPVKSAWKTPLTQKLNSDISKETVKETTEESPIAVEEKESDKSILKFKNDKSVDKKKKKIKFKIIHSFIHKPAEKTHDAMAEEEKKKEEGVTKIFDNKNFVEAPLPKTNPWSKKSSKSSAAPIVGGM